ncbi:MAG: hypothetical protein LBC95_01890 [Candidatus Nomurabacteria bacterium]|nr:hypothetical protein [Candidatus Nomurabacteria bacterium]
MIVLLTVFAVIVMVAGCGYEKTYPYDKTIEFEGRYIEGNDPYIFAVYDYDLSGHLVSVKNCNPYIEPDDVIEIEARVTVTDESGFSPESIRDCVVIKYDYAVGTMTYEEEEYETGFGNVRTEKDPIVVRDDLSFERLTDCDMSMNALRLWEGKKVKVKIASRVGAGFIVPASIKPI